ncbi:MAG: 30S ribosomal protein S13 [Candidatus Micrarchaeota archaeon]|nr:30S ribosomal protein S13 [Candidatus Micrarchaeota archaeon]
MAEAGKRDAKHEPSKKPQGPSSIVRVAGKDMDGSLPIARALSKVKGIGHNMAQALSLAADAKLGIPTSTSIGSLSEEQVAQLEALIKDPIPSGIPWYMLNRNKDMETGKNIHIVSNDLIFNTRQDVSRDVSNGTWRGFRHQYGQKVRGQHTRSTGRTGATVGVTKSKAAPAGGPAQTGKGGPAKTEAKKEAAPAPAKK